jgi:tripartite-type tricarboxylate transporter receptor subunit TctC
MQQRIARLFPLIAPSALAIVLASSNALAQEFPAKPIRMVVGFLAGTGVDVSGRIVAQMLADGFGQPVVVENKPGMASIIAAREVSKSAPDGYTLFMCTTSSHVTGPFLTRQQPYDPIKDFTLIAQVVESYLVAAAPATIPPNSLKEFAAWAKANTGKVYYASPGVGGSSHLLAERFNRAAGLNMTHVPYKGSGVPELAGGETQLLFALPATVNVGSRLKLLAVSSPKRMAELPHVPTAREAGFPDAEAVLWQGVCGPGNMPKEVVMRLTEEVKRGLARPDVRERYAKIGTPVTYRAPAEFAELAKGDVASWLPIIKASGAVID